MTQLFVQEEIISSLPPSRHPGTGRCLSGWWGDSREGIKQGHVTYDIYGEIKISQPLNSFVR